MHMHYKAHLLQMLMSSATTKMPLAGFTIKNYIRSAMAPGQTIYEIRRQPHGQSATALLEALDRNRFGGLARQTNHYKLSDVSTHQCHRSNRGRLQIVPCQAASQQSPFFARYDIPDSIRVPESLLPPSLPLNFLLRPGSCHLTMVITVALSCNTDGPHWTMSQAQGRSTVLD